MHEKSRVLPTNKDIKENRKNEDALFKNVIGF